METKINTVNVIEYVNDSVMGIQSFLDTTEGSKEASGLFMEILKEHGVTDAEEVACCLDDGFWEQGEYQIFLTHSS